MVFLLAGLAISRLQGDLTEWELSFLSWVTLDRLTFFLILTLNVLVLLELSQDPGLFYLLLLTLLVIDEFLNLTASFRKSFCSCW